MQLTLTRNQLREIDRRAAADYGISSLVLMENAGRGAADLLCRLLDEAGKPHGPVAVVCGKGNNGGDGFVIARHLELRGIEVKVLLLADPAALAGDAATNYRILEKAGLSIEKFDSPLEVDQFNQALVSANYLVDAILGTGAVGEPKSPYAEAIACLNATRLPILAIDLPSGLDCDTGAASLHTIGATHTCTFAAPKPGFFMTGASHYVGKLHTADIGIPKKLLHEMTDTTSR